MVPKKKKLDDMCGPDQSAEGTLRSWQREQKEKVMESLESVLLPGLPMLL